MFSRTLTRSIAIGAAAMAVGGGAYGIVSATASTGPGTATTATSAVATSVQPVPGSRGSNARSGPAAGGSIGRVSSVSSSGFELLTSAGEKVTVKETSSTSYEKGNRSASASAVTKGKTALVLGTTSSTTITATQVIVQTTSSRSVTSSKVIPFKRGAQSASKQAGQIGDGTGELHAGVRHDRQRNHGEQGHESRIGRLLGRRRRSCCAPEQRRVRGPQHRRQLAAPHLREQGVQGRRGAISRPPPAGQQPVFTR